MTPDFPGVGVATPRQIKTLFRLKRHVHRRIRIPRYPSSVEVSALILAFIHFNIPRTVSGGNLVIQTPRGLNASN